MNQLICMRLTEMLMRHPLQVERKCSRCDETVGIFPSGQKELKRHGPNIEIICSHCFQPEDTDAVCEAEGAIRERKEAELWRKPQ